MAAGSELPENKEPPVLTADGRRIMSKGILDGVVVLDLTRVLAGPYCGMLLAPFPGSAIQARIISGLAMISSDRPWEAS